MKMGNTEFEKWSHEYSEFIHASEPVPRKIDDEVNSQIHDLLHPSSWLVFAKLATIHAVAGYLSLAVCHQFGMNPFNTRAALTNWLMNFNESVCVLGCGIAFMFFSFLAAGTLLSGEELRALRRNEFAQATALAVISIGVFFVAGATLAVGLAVLWLFGAIVSGVIVTESAAYLRFGARTARS